MDPLTAHSDVDLIQKVLLDDHDAFRELYNRHWESLYNSAYKRLQSETACQDIVQDVFTDVWVRRSTLNIENVSAYLHTAVRFQVIKFLARNKISAHFIQPFENIVDTSLKADYYVNEKELNCLVKSWMSTLPKKRLRIYQLYINENLSPKEIAARLSISTKTVQNQLGISMHGLRSKIGQLFSFLF